MVPVSRLAVLMRHHEVPSKAAVLHVSQSQTTPKTVPIRAPVVFPAPTVFGNSGVSCPIRGEADLDTSTRMTAAQGIYRSEASNDATLHSTTVVRPAAITVNHSDGISCCVGVGRSDKCRIGEAFEPVEWVRAEEPAEGRAGQSRLLLSSAESSFLPRGGRSRDCTPPRTNSGLRQLGEPGRSRPAGPNLMGMLPGWNGRA